MVRLQLHAEGYTQWENQRSYRALVTSDLGKFPFPLFFILVGDVAAERDAMGISGG